MKFFGILRPTDNGWVWEWVFHCPGTSLVEMNPDYWMPLPEPPEEKKK
jgi:hypothetical protein